MGDDKVKEPKKSAPPKSINILASLGQGSVVHYNSPAEIQHKIM